MKSFVSPILALAALCSAASAAQIVGYSFTDPPYTVGNDLNGQQGWTGAVAYDANNVKVSSTGLTNAGMLGETGGSIIGSTIFASGEDATLLSSTTGTDTETGTGVRWFAALVTLTGNGGSAEGNFVRLSIDSSNTGFVFGLQSTGAGGTGTSSGYFFMFGGQSTNGGAGFFVSDSGFTGSQYVGGTTALVVGKVVVNSVLAGADEAFQFWLNPTDATSESTLTSTAQGTMSRTLNVIGGDWGTIRTGTEMTGSGGLGFMQDEIRVGTALSDLNLTAVPEPATWALLAFSLTTVVILRRRRNS